MTVDEFVVWERRRELWCEFDGFEPVAMIGGTLDHSAIATRQVSLVDARLRAGCRTCPGDVNIIAAGRVRYPDAVVTCSPIGKSDVLPDPVIVFEVLSACTASIDRMIKNAGCAAAPSLQRHIMLEQALVGTAVYVRDGGTWPGNVLLEDSILSMPETGVDILLRDVYTTVDLPKPRIDD